MPNNPNYAVRNGNTMRNGNQQIVKMPTSDTSICLYPEETFPEQLSGCQVLRAYAKDICMRIIYFYASESSWLFYIWTAIVAAGVFYNTLAMVIFIFDDIYNDYFWTWIILNISFDIVYVVDILIMTRKTYICEGGEIRNHKLTLRHYLKDPAPVVGSFHCSHYEIGGRLLLDILSILPFDFILFVNPSLSLIRTFRILKAHRFMDFVEQSGKRMPFPHALKIMFLMLSCVILFHWNACVYFMFSLAEGLSEEDQMAFGFSYYKVFHPRIPLCSVYEPGCLMAENMSVPDIDDYRPKYIKEMYAFWENRFSIQYMSNFSREYSMSIYWSALTITTCGQQPYPSSSSQNMLEVVDTLIGVLVFATIIGSVGSMVTHMNRSVYEFRQKMDGIKFYMKYREVNVDIQQRVLNCFMYMNSQHQLTDEAEVLGCLPPRLQGQFAENLHMDTLKDIGIFQGCAPGFLYELVINVKQQIYSPNDYICRSGDKAKEMYIVKRGCLNVIDDGTKTVLEVITDGGTFGEMSIVHINGNLLGDTRSCSLRSQGYSDVYILSQDDVTSLMQEYPADRRVLMKNVRDWLDGRGLLDPIEGAMNGTDEDEGPMYSLEEQLMKLKRKIENIDDQLLNMCTSFNELSTDMKRRVTTLETIHSCHKKTIKRDIMRKF